MKMRKKTLGIILLLFPWVLLPLVLAAYAIMSYVLSAGGSQSNLLGVGNIIQLLLGFMGVLAVLSFLVGTPVGIFLISRKEPDRFDLLKSRPRFQSLTDVELHTVSRWSWSAFLNPTFWALGNRLWFWALGSLIPLWGVYVWLRLAIDGRQMVWERSQLTFAQFCKRQKMIAWVIGIFTIVSLVYWVIPGGSREIERAPESLSVAEQIVTDGEMSTDALKKEALGAKDESAAKMFTVRNAPYDCALFKDSDVDGLADQAELVLMTNVASSDTDSDGYEDRAELLAGYSPNGEYTHLDTDGDGLADAWEDAFYHSNATLADSDRDGLSDLEEVKAGNSPSRSELLDGMYTRVGIDLLFVQAAQKQCAFE